MAPTTRIPSLDDFRAISILIHAPAFYPMVGGYENVFMALASEFTKAGHAVTVATQARSDAPDAFPFQVVRHPSPMRFASLLRSADVFLQGNVSLKGLWALAAAPTTPYFISHQGWYVRPNGSIGARDRLKYAVTRAAVNIACSHWVARHLPVPATVIPNPYDDATFRPLPNVERDLDLVFLGRLVSDKGLDTLLRALAALAAHSPRLTVIGSGPEEAPMKALAHELGLAGRVDFVGTLTGDALAEMLNRHRIMVVPSRWEEPFGIVALEGIACGCVVVGTERGGLREAIGDCGVTFPNGDHIALAARLKELLNTPGSLETYRRAASVHLERHTARHVAQMYLDAIQHARRPSSR